jgi:hypothetical protein
MKNVPKMATKLDVSAITDNVPRAGRPKGPTKPRSELTPLQLRRWCSKRVLDATKSGRLPRLKGSGIKCMDCGEPATCYDHRNYYHPLAVDPVCKRCNNKRGPGFPINPISEYQTAAPDGNAGRRWSSLEAGISDQHPGYSPRSLLKNMPESSVAEFYDEHWKTWEQDWDLTKIHQEVRRFKNSRNYWATSFLRGLHDWYGIQPI